jgi:hypothetical protein
VVVVGDIAVDDFAADARKPGPRRGAQRNQSARQPVIAEESPAVHNGGYLKSSADNAW